MTERDVRDKALARIVANEIGLIYSIGTGKVDKDGNEILVVPPIFKDVRDLTTLFGMPWDLGKRGPRYMLNKMDFLLRAALEFGLNKDLSSGQSIAKPGMENNEAIISHLMNAAEKYTPEGMFGEKTKWNLKKESWEKRLNLMGIRTKRNVGGVGARGNIYRRRKEMGQRYALERMEAKQKMMEAYYGGDMATFIRLASQYYVSDGEIKNMMLQKANPLLGQFLDQPEQVRQRVLSEQGELEDELF